LKIDLSGKSVLVTGGSRGIGAAIVRVMGQCGARIAVHYHERAAPAEALAGEAGRGSAAFAADLSTADACVQLWRSVLDRFGRIDVLVNNAGIVTTGATLGSQAEWRAAWDEMINLNLASAAHLSREAVNHFVSNGGGRIINMSSRVAFRGGTEGHIAYATSKGGLVTLTRSIVRSFGKSNVTAFVVAPGFVRTEQSAPFIAEDGEENIVAELSLARLTEPMDVAPMVAFLASGLADHATGSTIDFNAGSYLH
jgi:NAD(P)-dependent dehydrogenase (short-subunit alcohol dehydrogenase family)